MTPWTNANTLLHALRSTMETPEFVRWTLQHACSLRGGKDWWQPERTERQLRALRAYWEAVRERRVFEGVCVERSEGRRPESGFLAAEVLEAFGGQEQVHAACGGCPANVVERGDPSGLAGCYGLLERGDLEPADRAIEESIRGTDIERQWSSLFAPTCPRWYGLWMDQLPGPDQLRAVLGIIDSRIDPGASPTGPLGELRSAIEVSLRTGIPLRWKLEPCGRIEGFEWIIPPHCSICMAPTTAESNGCSVCSRPRGKPTAQRRRRVRGDRPYWRLERFLGQDNVESFLDRYSQSQLGGWG